MPAPAIGSLFFRLGLKGATKVKKSFSGLSKFLNKDISSLKVLDVAKIYGLNKFAEGLKGTSSELIEFNALTGIGTTRLQKLQLAGQKFGVQASDIISTFKRLQSIAGQVRAGKGLPEGFGAIAERTGLILEDFEKPEKAFYKLRQYAIQERDTAIANERLRSVGLSDELIAAFRRGAFSRETLNIEVLSPETLKRINEASLAFSNVSNHLKIIGGQLFEIFGFDRVLKETGSFTERFLNFFSSGLKRVRANQKIEEELRKSRSKETREETLKRLTKSKDPQIAKEAKKRLEWFNLKKFIDDAFLNFFTFTKAKDRKSKKRKEALFNQGFDGSNLVSFPNQNYKSNVEIVNNLSLRFGSVTTDNVEKIKERTTEGLQNVMSKTYRQIEENRGN